MSADTPRPARDEARVERALLVLDILESEDGTAPDVLRVARELDRLRVEVGVLRQALDHTERCGEPNRPYGTHGREGTHVNLFRCTLPKGHTGDHVEQAVIASWVAVAGRVTPATPKATK